MSDKTQKALVKALYKVLRPMVRLLLRHGVSYRLFAEVARHIYVEVAESDFALPGRKPSHARTAVLTGINRKDIAKLKGRENPLTASHPETPTPVARVITGWLNDGRFHADGRPRPLRLDETNISQQSGDDTDFSALVREYSSDVPVRALLDELLRIDAVQQIEGWIHLQVSGYIPIADMEETLRIFGTAAADLLGTMDHNIGQLGPRFLQRTVSYQDIPAELLPEIRRRARVEGEALLLQINEWLARCDRDQNPDLIGSGRFRAGIGIYYLENAEETTKKTEDEDQ